MSENAKKVEQASSGIATYVLGGVLALSLAYSGYIYATKDILKKGELEYKYIKKSNVQNEYIKKDQINFENLPYNVKNRYVLKTKYENEIKSIKNSQPTQMEPKIIEKIVEVEKVVEIEKIIEVEKKVKPKIIERIIEVEKNTEPKIIEKIVEIEKVVEVEKIIEIEKFKDALPLDKSKYNTYTCKTLDSSSIKITSYCKKGLNNFLNTNKKAKIFEVIGLVDNKEFNLIQALKDVYGTKRVGNLSLYAKIGLSRQRVIEATWLIKRNLGSFIKINTVNYTVTAKNKRGFVVRAYK